ncbi:hypothetical protein D3C80_1646860 [compost metagenome]
MHLPVVSRQLERHVQQEGDARPLHHLRQCRPLLQQLMQAQSHQNQQQDKPQRGSGHVTLAGPEAKARAGAQRHDIHRPRRDGRDQRKCRHGYHQTHCTPSSIELNKVPKVMSPPARVLNKTPLSSYE